MTKSVIERVAVTLKPCPFCGGDPYLFKGGFPFARDWAACYGKREGFEHPVVSMPLDKWNTRAALQSSGVEEMVEALEALISSADSTAWGANVGTMDSAIEAARTALARYRGGGI
jgi:hypothetical protein